jgi:hypothetical protein
MEKTTFENLYPAVAEWTKDWGWIEMGYDDMRQSFIRVLDIGGTIWEGKNHYKTVDDALKAAEKAIEGWHEENG